MSRLIIFYKNTRIGEYIFSEEEFSIGRSVENQIMLDDQMVSRKHAIIKLVGNQYVLTDLGSDTGTTLNNEKVITEVLKNNDNIEIGPYRLHCQIEVMESLIHHLSSQIDHVTGDTDPRMVQGLQDEDRVHIRHTGQTGGGDDTFMEKINTLAFYAGIVIALILIGVVVFYFLSEPIGTG